MTKAMQPLNYNLEELSDNPPVLERFYIEELQPVQASLLVTLIQNNMKEFDQREKVFSVIHRRLQNFATEYSKDGCCLFVAKTLSEHKPVACIGLGSFQGLPVSECIGEVRDLVVQKEYRHQGIGQKLLRKILLHAKDFGYKRLYLEMSEHMQVAHKLFMQNGFQPVKHLPQEKKSSDKDPSYFLLEDLQSNIIPVVM